MKKLSKILIFSFLLVATLGISRTASASISCAVTDGNPPNGSVVILKMSSASNAHASLPTASDYDYVIYCSGSRGLSNSCSGKYEVFAKLSSATNAHVRAATEADYPGGNNACISGGSSAKIEVGYGDGNCAGYDTTLASISNFPTNAHIGNADAYPKKICASFSVPSSSGGYLKNFGQGSSQNLVNTVSNAVVSTVQTVFEGVKEIGTMAKSITGKFLASNSKQTFSRKDLTAENRELSGSIANAVPSEEGDSLSNQKEMPVLKPEALLASANASNSNLARNLPIIGLFLILISILIFVGRRIYLKKAQQVN